MFTNCGGTGAPPGPASTGTATMFAVPYCTQIALPKSLPITRYEPASEAGCTPRSAASSASVGTGRPGWACAQKNGPMSIGSPATTSECATTGGTPCRDTAACSNRKIPGPNAPASSCATPSGGIGGAGCTGGNGARTGAGRAGPSAT